jgi:hypothetical protein
VYIGDSKQSLMEKAFENLHSTGQPIYLVPKRMLQHGIGVIQDIYILNKQKNHHDISVDHIATTRMVK